MTRQEANRDLGVLHVLPHPGGGGETYVDALSRLEGYRAERTYLTRANGGVRAAASVAGNAVKVQWAARSHDLLHVHGEIAGAACLVGIAASRSVVTLHGLHLLRRLDGVTRLAAEANLRLIVRAATRTICVSDAEQEDVRGAVGARAADSVVMIHNGVASLPPPSPEDRAAVRAELRIAESTVVGVWVGSLDERKDPLTPVRAILGVARAGADVALVVAGDGPLRPQLDAVVRESAGVVKALGYRTDVQRILAAADFFVLSSEREGLSYSLLEAMSMGLPAVVSEGAGNPEAIGDTGIVVTCGDTAGFAAAFERLAGDEGERRRLGAHARERVARSFNLDEMLRQTKQVYDAVVGGDRR